MSDLSMGLSAFTADQLYTRLKELGDPRISKYEENLILNVDSYKFIHHKIYKIVGVKNAFSYVEARLKDSETVFFGLQMFLKKYMSQRITMEMIDEAEEYCKNHFGRDDIFPRELWEVIVKDYDGYPPIKIRAVAEGMVIPTGNALVTVELIGKARDDERLAFLVAYFETAILRAIWYPVTVASKSRSIKKLLKKYLQKTCDDNKIDSILKFMLHDFGYRGVSSKESAGIGGLAHLANFYGTDTTEANRYGKWFYNIPMAGISVGATEHSVMTLRGKDGELQLLREVIENFSAPGAILSIVMDGYDIYRAVGYLCNELKDLVLAKGCKIVVRPDSGDASEIIPTLMRMLDEAFGSTVNTKGYKVLNGFSILQGDGLSTLDDFEKILIAVMNAGFSVENLVFGMGGGLLQHVNRDDFKFAQKTSAAEIGDEWIDVFKSPITDPGKESKKGRLQVLGNSITGEIVTIREGLVIKSPGWVPLLEDVWVAGKLVREQDFVQIRELAEVI